MMYSHLVTLLAKVPESKAQWERQSACRALLLRVRAAAGAAAAGAAA